MERIEQGSTSRLRRLAVRGAVALATGASLAMVSAPAASAARFVEHPHVKTAHKASPRRHRPVVMASIASANGIATSPEQQFAVGGAAMTTARQIANAYWGYDPCGGQVAISWASLDPSINATSTWWNPTDAYADPQENNNCQVQFNVNQSFDWQMFCTVFVHELGHLTGHPHAQDQNNVMYPVYVQPISQCVSTPDPTATVAVPAAAVRATTSSSHAHARVARHKHHRRHHKRHAKRHR